MTARTRQLSTFLAAGLIAVMITTPVRAQDVSLAPQPAPRTDSAAAAPVAQAGPTSASASVAVHSRDAVSRDPMPAAPKNSFDKGVPLMIVGVAAILGGIVVGSDAGHIISVGGVVVGLYGLYQYLQ